MDGLITKHVAACELAAVLCMHTDESNALWEYSMSLLDGFEEKVPEEIRRLNLYQFRLAFVVPFAIAHLRKSLTKAINEVDVLAHDGYGNICNEVEDLRVLGIK